MTELGEPMLSDRLGSVCGTFTQFLVRMEGLLKKRALMRGKDAAVASNIRNLS